MQLNRFPDNLRIVKNYLKAVHYARGPGCFEAEKMRLLAKLDEAAIGEVVAGFPTGWLTALEWEPYVKQKLDSANELQLLHILESNDLNLLKFTHRSLGAGASSLNSVIRRMLEAKIGDIGRITGGTFGTISWGEFKAESDSLTARLPELARTAVAGPSSVTGDMGLSEAVLALERIVRRAGAAWLNSSASYYDAASFSVWLRERIAHREPTSFVRFGDGEGTFLPYPHSIAEFQIPDRSLMQRIMWDDEFFPGLEAKWLEDGLVGVALRADALGVSPIIQLLKVGKLDGTTRNSRYRRGECNVLSFFDGVGTDTLQNMIVVSNKIQSDLNGWNLYRQIFRDVSSVSMVSCHDLSGFLARELDLSVRSWHRIPAQKKHLGMFGHEAEQAGERFYPDIFGKIMAGLDPERGEIFLVAAGILGKLMCDRIKERGGIAIDIGSLADYWLGFGTRFYGATKLDFEHSTTSIDVPAFRNRF